MIFRIAFYLLYPLVWLYAPLVPRSRVLLVCGQEFLAVKNLFGNNRWQLPGGGQKRGETSAQTVVREINEELGFRINPMDLKTLLNYGFYKNSGAFCRGQIFSLELSEKPLITSSRELSETAWLPITTNEKVGKIVTKALEAYNQSSENAKNFN